MLEIMIISGNNMPQGFRIMLRGIISTENVKLWHPFSVRVERGVRLAESLPSQSYTRKGKVCFLPSVIPGSTFSQKIHRCAIYRMRENLDRKVDTTLSSRLLVDIRSWFSFAV